MGKPVAGKLLKFFEQAELQTIIARAQTLRSVPPDELADLVGRLEERLPFGVERVIRSRESIAARAFAPA